MRPRETIMSQLHAIGDEIRRKVEYRHGRRAGNARRAAETSWRATGDMSLAGAASRSIIVVVVF